MIHTIQVVRKYPSEFDIGYRACSCKTISIVTDSERGEVLCAGCGQILKQGVSDISTEEGIFMQDEYMERTRIGPASSLSMYDRGLYTVIGRNVDATGNAIHSTTKETFNRLRVWDKRSKPRHSSSLGKALTGLNAMKKKLGIPDSVIEDAAYIYRKAVASKLTRGRTLSSLVAASLYVACRESGTLRSLDDISLASNVQKKILSRDLRTLIKKLELNLNQYDSTAFVVRLANNMDLKEKVKRDAIDILLRSKEAGITTGKHPVALAATALYLACIRNDERMNQRTFATTVGVSDVTIRNRIAQIRKTIRLD